MIHFKNARVYTKTRIFLNFREEKDITVDLLIYLIFPGLLSAFGASHNFLCCWLVERPRPLNQPATQKGKLREGKRWAGRDKFQLTGPIPTFRLTFIRGFISLQR